MKRTRSIYLALLAVLLSPMAANAVPVVVGGELQGATEVDVGGVLYDVTFDGNACVSQFDGCDAVSNLDFGTQADAFAAMDTLVSLIFQEFQSYFTPEIRIRDCLSSEVCRLMIPFDVGMPNQQGFRNVTIWSADLLPGGFIVQEGNPSTWSANIQTSDRIYARFSPVSVSEPGTLALLGLGLAGMAARHKKTV